MRIKLHTLYGPNVSIRRSINKLKEELDDYKGPVILDFEGVEFISRAFADELCDLEEKYPILEEQNKCEYVRNIIHLVKEGRRMHIKPSPSASQSSTRSFDTLEELEEWLNGWGE